MIKWIYYNFNWWSYINSVHFISKYYLYKFINAQNITPNITIKINAIVRAYPFNTTVFIVILLTLP